MAPSLYQSNWKHNRLMTDTTPFSKMELGMGCGGVQSWHRDNHWLQERCMHFSTGQDWVPTVHSQTVHFSYCSVRSSQPAKGKHILTAVHSTVRAGQGCQDPHHLLQMKQTHFSLHSLLPYQIRKVSTHLPSLAVSVIRNRDQTSNPAQQALSGWLIL